MKRLFLLLALCGMVAVGCTEGGPDDNINNGGGNNTEQPGGETDDDLDDEVNEIPSNEIWYTSTDNLELLPLSTKMHIFGANLTSNIYKDGKGVLTFDGIVDKIGDGAFSGCITLASITIPDSVNEIGDGAFQNCIQLTSINIPASVTTIGDNAFQNCIMLKSINIPASVTTIGVNAFHSCVSLTSVTIPEGVTEIGNDAFAMCYFTAEKFINNSSLDSADNGYWGAWVCEIIQDDGLCIDGSTAVYCRPNATSVTIPDSVTEIGSAAFLGCVTLTSVIIPEGVTEIGSQAFADCRSLTSVTIPASVTSVSYLAFAYCSSLKEVYCKPTTPPTGDSSMFYDNASGRKIYVPTKSVDAYKSAECWSDYADYFEGYDF